MVLYFRFGTYRESVEGELRVLRLIVDPAGPREIPWFGIEQDWIMSMQTKTMHPISPRSLPPPTIEINSSSSVSSWFCWSSEGTSVSVGRSNPEGRFEPKLSFTYGGNGHNLSSKGEEVVSLFVQDEPERFGWICDEEIGFRSEEQPRFKVEETKAQEGGFMVLNQLNHPVAFGKVSKWNSCFGIPCCVPMTTWDEMTFCLSPVEYGTLTAEERNLLLAYFSLWALRKSRRQGRWTLFKIAMVLFIIVAVFIFAVSTSNGDSS